MGSAFGAIWEDPNGGFIKFMVKRASKQDQTLHMEEKLYIILYFNIVRCKLIIVEFYLLFFSVYGLLHTFRVGSVYVTLAVTFERFHAIICPLRHFKWKKYMLPFCICFAVLYNMPKYFELEMVVSSYK